MNRALFMIQNIIWSAERAAALTNYMMSLPEMSHNPYGGRLLVLLSDLKEHTLHFMEKFSTQAEKEELKNDAHIMYEAGSMIDEMHMMLKNTLPSSIPIIFKNRLDYEIYYIIELLTGLSLYMKDIFGPREVLYVVTPGFAALSGIWK